MYALAVFSPSRIPRIGNAIIGTSEVAARGNASVIHQTAMRDAIAAILVKAGFEGSKSMKIRIEIKIKSPKKNPNFRITNIKLTIC